MIASLSLTSLPYVCPSPHGPTPQADSIVTCGIVNPLNLSLVSCHVQCLAQPISDSTTPFLKHSDAIVSPLRTVILGAAACKCLFLFLIYALFLLGLILCLTTGVYNIWVSGLKNGEQIQWLWLVAVKLVYNYILRLRIHLRENFKLKNSESLDRKQVIVKLYDNTLLKTKFHASRYNILVQEGLFKVV